MRRFGALRSPCFIFVLFVVISVQISLNLLLSQCGENQGYAREGSALFSTKRSLSTGTENQDIIAKLYATEQALLALKLELKLNKETKQNITEELRKGNSELMSQMSRFNKLEKIINAQDLGKVKNEILKSDFLKGDTVNNELEVVPFDSFTTTGIYTVNKEGLVNRPAIRPHGTRSKEHFEMLKFSLKVLNSELRDHEKVTYNNLDNGITRLDRLNGMQYNLFFTASKPNEYHRVKIRRPFSNLELVDSIETVDTSKEPINLIIPLSGRTQKFQAFLKRFADVCVRWDSRVFLTIVYFGEKDRDLAQEMLHDLERKENFTSYKFISEKEPFSRGAGLQKGVLSWKKGNNIMFFCDVDVYFTPDFLERCRLYSEPGKMVYYPIVYSLYNPDVVYNGAPPSIDKQLYVGKHNGFWRDFGFGMTCQYRNDFISTKGFDTTIHGWGTEDLKLYRKFLSMDLTTIRATDRGIFHLYHPKYCDPVLSGQQYLSCLNSKAVNEGSHMQMGMLAFGANLFSNLQPDWKSKQLSKPNFAKRNKKVKSKEVDRLWEKADELDIETLEIKLLANRLEAVMNFTVLGNDIFKLENFNFNLLNELELSVNERANLVKRLAIMIEKKYEELDNKTSRDVL